ncbi:endo-beta-N-acetylglucosaminidase [Mesoplasma corruscae]|uniref:Endo-beta-N-acetylglucosaminidase n=1 Tax=Mesoplasma corruscae TaxID=216874 RepID=A0A2S5RGA3_9MOLU|nr:hypothetical protein [Mesoplasma corruscae]PPE06242.1 endo-beta-N-acetylglucosaminidase [Mesoplasma corruscae]
MAKIKKKNLTILFLSTIVTSSMSTYVFSCVDKVFGTDISSFANYDWIKEEPYFKGYEEVSPIKAPVQNVQKIESNTILPNSYFDLSTQSTAFKTKLEIKKQATTGVPLNSKFLPNGNYVSDFKKVKREDFYNETNKLVDWTSLADLDAKYNKSKIKLQDTEKTMLAWTKYQDPQTKELNMSTIMESTSLSNSNIGNKRVYERSFNNYQYNDILVSWAGAIDEGIIVPPAKNQVEKAHLNGTKILGNIFLDGYHGLTKQNLKGFLDKDDMGKYKVTSVLIEMAVYLGFDGWFWNNEPNGASPNSTVVDTKITTEIMKQLKDEIKLSSNSQVQKLEVYGYKNYGRLSAKEDGRVDLEAEDIYNNTDYFIQDFWNFSDGLQNYFEENNISENDRFKVFNMYNAGAWVDSKIWLDKNKIGKRDLRDLNYIPLDQNGEPFTNTYLMEEAYLAQPKDGKLETITFKEKDDESTNEKIKGSKNSISFFAAHVPYDIASQEMDEIAGNNKTKNVDLDVYGMVAANNYDDMMYTGANKALSDLDKGVAAYPHSWNQDWSKIYKDKSYGIGNLIQEKTVLIDSNNFFKTNFSTGQGKKFVTANIGKNFSTIENYPWSNTNIADVQPTYKWDLTKKSSEEVVINANSKNPITGFYDYKNVYLKGNSISLGSGYNQKGEIQESTWDANSEYTWNIMGSNYKETSEKNISAVLRVPKSFDQKNTSIHIIDNNGKKITLDTSVEKLSYESDANYNWIELVAKTNSQIAKIGITIKTNSEDQKFLISCGEIKVTKNEGSKIKKENNAEDKSSIKIESLIKKNNKTSLRFSFNDSSYDENDKYAYYEIYYKNLDNKLVRLTENITNNFYIKDLNNNTSSIYIKKIPNNTSYEDISWFQFSI